MEGEGTRELGKGGTICGSKKTQGRLGGTEREIGCWGGCGLGWGAGRCLPVRVNSSVPTAAPDCANGVRTQASAPAFCGHACTYAPPATVLPRPVIPRSKCSAALKKLVTMLPAVHTARHDAQVGALCAAALPALPQLGVPVPASKRVVCECVRVCARARVCVRACACGRVIVCAPPPRPVSIAAAARPCCRRAALKEDRGRVSQPAQRGQGGCPGQGVCVPEGPHHLCHESHGRARSIYVRCPPTWLHPGMDAASVAARALPPPGTAVHQLCTSPPSPFPPTYQDPHPLLPLRQPPSPPPLTLPPHRRPLWPPPPLPPPPPPSRLAAPLPPLATCLCPVPHLLSQRRVQDAAGGY
jgi:hypothetical protein